MKKSLRKLIPAFVMMVVTMALLGTSTFAWFSMNNKVTISGMSVTTQVSSNLLVASGTAGTTSAGESAFHTSVNQSVSGIIEPVSTVNGVDFFYTTSGLANGDSEADDYVAYDAANTAAFNTAYNTMNAEGYKDYVIELKADNTSASAKYIALTKLDLVYTGTATDNSKAHRVAMFVQDGTYDGSNALTGYAAIGSVATCILDVTDSANQTADYAVSAAATAPTAISIMASQALTSIQVAANSTKYFKVTLRLYLEGEDTTCTNATFLALTDAWRLETQFELKDNATSSITEISKYTAKTLSIKAVDTLVYYDGTNLYKAEDMTLINNDGATTIPAANLSADALGTTELDAINAAYSTSFTIA